MPITTSVIIYILTRKFLIICYMCRLVFFCKTKFLHLSWCPLDNWVWERRTVDWTLLNMSSSLFFLCFVCFSNLTSPPRSPIGSGPYVTSYTLSSPTWPAEWATFGLGQSSTHNLQFIFEDEATSFACAFIAVPPGEATGALQIIIFTSSLLFDPLTGSNMSSLFTFFKKKEWWLNFSSPKKSCFLKSALLVNFQFQWS